MLPRIVRKEWRTLPIVFWGMLVYSTGVVLFTIPFRFPDSGVMGIASLLRYSFGLSIPIVYAALNVFLLAWAWRGLSKRVVIWTIIALALGTVMMELLDLLPKLATEQRLLVALIGGAIKGYGSGVLLRDGVTAGGMDLIILYMRKRYGIEAGKISLYINLAIICLGAYIVGAENAMLGFAGIYASSIALDHTMMSFDRRRQVFIITKEPKPIVDFILAMGRGATVVDAHGGYTGDDVKLVISLLSRRQSVDVRRFIADSMPRTFMVVSEASEVVGRGFNPWK